MNAAQIALARKTGGTGLGRDLVSEVATLTMTAGATAVGSIDLPAGAIIRSIDVETAAAFSGSPTNINFRAGTTSDGSGQQIVADVDVKAAGHFKNTLVAAFVSALTALTTVYFRIAATGGTNPAGSITVIIVYLAPAP